MAVGAYGLTGHNKAEWFDSPSDTSRWSELPDCPIADRYRRVLENYINAFLAELSDILIDDT